METNIYLFKESADFWIILQTLAIIGSLIYIIRQTWISKLANTVNAIRDYRNEWDSSSMEKSRIECCKSSELFNSTTTTKNEARIMNFYESLGLSLKYQVVDKNYVYHEFGYYIEYFWLLFKDKINDSRMRDGDETLYEYFEYLNKKMKKIAGNKYIYGDKSEEEIKRFIEDTLFLED